MQREQSDESLGMTGKVEVEMTGKVGLGMTL